MSKRTKRALLSTSMFVLGTLAVWLALNGCHYVGVARAQGIGGGQTVDPTSQIVDFLTAGQYLPAIGAVMVALVGLVRAGLLRWSRTKAFADSQLGGYVVAYGVSMIVYVGTALEQAQPVTLKLLLMGCTAALTASGVLDHWRDILGATKRTPNGAATLLVLILGVSALGCSGCHEVKDSKPVAALVECLKENQVAIEATAGQCGAKAPDWTAVETCVVAAAPQVGYKVGGCVLGQLVNDYLMKKSTASDVAGSHAAHDSFEDYRAKYLGGATVQTKDGAKL